MGEESGSKLGCEDTQECALKERVSRYLAKELKAFMDAVVEWLESPPEHTYEFRVLLLIASLASYLSPSVLMDVLKEAEGAYEKRRKEDDEDEDEDGDEGTVQ